jgi:hypothetical protein
LPDRKSWASWDDIREEDPMKTLLASIVVVALSLGVVSAAEAQVVVSTGWAGLPLSAGPEYYSPYGVPPYSYYAAIPFPARGYVGYGYNDFPYYGRPYGSPSDPWTWPYMSSGGWALARYYYPPVR